MAKELRFRRQDAWNFVIESKRIVEDPKSPNLGQVQWDGERFFSDVRLMLKTALQMGIEGTGLEEFSKSLKASEATVLKALDDAIKSGALKPEDLVPAALAEARAKKVQ